MVLRRLVFNPRNALNDRSAEHDVAGTTARIYLIDHSCALSPAFLETSCSLITRKNSSHFVALMKNVDSRFTEM